VRNDNSLLILRHEGISPLLLNRMMGTTLVKGDMRPQMVTSKISDTFREIRFGTINVCQMIIVERRIMGSHMA
jgi:hypothetical protein